MSTIQPQQLESMEAAFVGHEDASLFLQLAEAYRAAGDPERALRVLRNGLEHHPACADGFRLLTEVLTDSGRLEEAAVCFGRLRELEPAAAPPVGLPVPPVAAAAGASAAESAAPASGGADPLPWEDDGADSANGNGRRKGPADAPAPVGATVDPAPAGVAVGAHAEPAAAHSPELDAAARALLEDARHVDSMAVAIADLLVGLLEYRDPFFRGGTSLTRLLTGAVARELGVDTQTTEEIALAAVLRDLGQLPLKGLISKVGSDLGTDGKRKVERHVETALELLEGVNLPATVRATIRHHHERWDGAGYPDQLVGDAIPLGARIVAVADSFAAMIAARPHRLPKRVPAALDDIRSGSGKQYDPAIVDALVRVLMTSSWRGLRFGLRHHVLIIDPDETRAMVLATKLCSHGYLAEAAFTPESAVERLLRSQLAGLVISADLPDSDTASLLRQVRETPRVGSIPVIVTDAGVSQRVPLLEGGADVCLNRGSGFEELKATFEAFLRREGKSVPSASAGKSADAPWSGLQGDVEDFPLNWLLQVLNYDGRSAAVFLTGDEDEGVIFLEKGNPRHAQTKALEGEPALRAMLRWKAGTFSVDPETRTEEHTIRAPLMNLLLDQAVQEDEAAFFGSVKTDG